MQPRADTTADSNRSFLACPGCGGLRWYVKDVPDATTHLDLLVVAYACESCHTTVQVQYSGAERIWTVAAVQREAGVEKRRPAPSGGSSSAPPPTMT